jgi:hypothetical protein
MREMSSSLNQGKGWIAAREAEVLLQSLRPKVEAILAHPSVTSKRLLQDGDREGEVFRPRPGEENRGFDPVSPPTATRTRWSAR